MPNVLNADDPSPPTSLGASTYTRCTVDD